MKYVKLDANGNLRLQLSDEQSSQMGYRHVVWLHQVNKCSPIVLTTERETRKILRWLLDNDFATQEAADAIEHALHQSKILSCPIMPVSDFEAVAYIDEHDLLECIYSDDSIPLTVGKKYKVSTASYRFAERYKRNKVHFNESTQETYTKEHCCELSGTDRCVKVMTDHGSTYTFKSRPWLLTSAWDRNEAELWKYFKKPEIKTVAEANHSSCLHNQSVMKSIEMLVGYNYYPGQMAYLSRVASKDCGLIAAETGTGKTLMAITLIALKSPNRALIIAPQGTTRSSDEEEDEIENKASQWVSEIRRFAPYVHVYEMFSDDDYEKLKCENGGQLPHGVFVSYYQAMFSNGAKEKVPESWDDVKLNKWSSKRGLAELPIFDNPRKWCEKIGEEVNGIRCIIEPCLATKVGDQFDMVLRDEAHVATNLGASITQMLIRLQPKHRWALTATPIPNIISNLFSLMGWLAVPNWYKGTARNAAWPYNRTEIGKFDNTFLSKERDETQELENLQRNKPSKCIKDSPIISSPARLLKLLKPTLAFISKRDCRPDYIEPEIIDVRVPMGKEQMKLYGHFLDRSNIKEQNPLVRARKQSAYLRNICADPAGFKHGGPTVSSNMNPKVLSILELAKDILSKGEQVVIINSRVGISNTISQKLAKLGATIARIDSTMDADQHPGQAELFKSGRAKVLIMGIKCAAAYSFDDCNNLIIGSLEYSYGPFNQAIGRIDRVTNKVKKKIYCILHKNSIEEIQYDIVSTKGDAAAICLRGQRVPRDYKPVDGSEILADAIGKFDVSGATPEIDCETKWNAQ